MKTEQFPNGFEDWHETHYEIVEAITLILCDDELDEDSVIAKRYEEQGRGGMYELAQELTDAFELEYEGAVWGEEMDYQETLGNFLSAKL